MVVLSKTNTDKICFPSSGKSVEVQQQSPPLPKKEEKRTILETIQLTIYRYNLWTGLYMLEPKERIAVNTLFGFLFFVWFWYTHMFLRGFFDGWNQGSSSAQQTTLE